MSGEWSEIVLNLRTNYKPLGTVAKECGSCWQHINRLARSEVNEPKFMVGIKLLDLHHDHCQHKHGEILKRLFEGE